MNFDTSPAFSLPKSTRKSIYVNLFKQYSKQTKLQIALAQCTTHLDLTKSSNRAVSVWADQPVNK